VEARTRIPSWLLIAIWLPANLFAQDCVERSQRQAFRYAVAVFRGTVQQVDNGDTEVSGTMLATFRVEWCWKGTVTEHVKICTIKPPSALGGYDFQKGESYIVYATNDPAWAKLCKASGTIAVYGIGIPCRLRVRSDVDQESRKLHWGHRPKRDQSSRVRRRADIRNEGTNRRSCLESAKVVAQFGVSQFGVRSSESVVRGL